MGSPASLSYINFTTSSRAVIVSPFISYEETWLTRRVNRQYDAIRQKIDTISNEKGLFIDRQMSFGVGFNTAVYGTFVFQERESAGTAYNAT